jgi:hypothetical protein
VTDPLALALSGLLELLDALNVRYAVGGSLASSAHGMLRATFDADIVVAILSSHIRPLCSGLGKEWYADPDMAEDALRHGRAFNLIHIPTGMKMDLFPATTQFHRQQLDRARVTRLPAPASISCRVVTAEDILLAKLRWYADGGCVSERQWNDITGLLAMNPTLDQFYLDHWAAQLDVTTLLDKARLDALR